LYTLAASILLEESVSGMLLEALRVSPKNAETVMHFIPVTETELESQHLLALRTSRNILQANEDKEWPKNMSACAPYAAYGSYGYPCEFQSLCTCPDYRTALSDYNVSEPFHPFKINKGKDTAKSTD
jgi:hypothetical protein